MNIVIFGTGAMGCLFAGLLAGEAHRSGAAIAMVGHWAAQLSVLQRRGLELIHLDGRRTRHRLLVAGAIDRLPAADLALVLVKSYQTAAVAPDVAAVLKPHGVCLTLQNGLGNREILARAAGPACTAIGTTAQAAMLVAPGVVQHTGSGHTVIGALPGFSTQLDEFVRLCRLAGIEAGVASDIEVRVWTKLAVNSAINPLSALLGLRNGELLQHAVLLELMRAVVDEVVRIAAARQVPLHAAEVFARVLEVCRVTAANRSSMLQDISSGRPTEIDAICGQVVRCGRACGLPAPLNRRLVEMVKKRANGGPVTIAALAALAKTRGS